jgi:mono/diheme cytochrome c family protein
MTSHRARAIAVVLLILATAPTAAETPQQRGEVLARGMCSACHAVGKSGSSKQPAAPRFRDLHKLTNLSKLSGRLQGGLLTGHEGMPLFRFSREEAEAMVAYIRSIQ